MLRDFFPSSEAGAKLYGGNLLEAFCFVKIYEFKESLQDQLDEVNPFLLENGYAQIDINDVDEEYHYDNFPVHFGPHAYLQEIVLTIKRDNCAKTQSEVIINELIKFRDERDWEQFHNPKDLAIALNIESSELLESFLWKSDKDANIEKVQEELADVIAYAYLIADKYKFNIEELVLNKIEQNADKYPVDKAKGSAKKYDEL